MVPFPPPPPPPPFPYFPLQKKAAFEEQHDYAIVILNDHSYIRDRYLCTDVTSNEGNTKLYMCVYVCVCIYINIYYILSGFVLTLHQLFGDVELGFLSQQH